MIDFDLAFELARRAIHKRIDQRASRAQHFDNRSRGQRKRRIVERAARLLTQPLFEAA
jgi:hypothetical protein